MNNPDTDAMPYTVGVQVDPDYVANVDSEQLSSLAKAALSHQGVATGELTVVLTDDASVQELNRNFRDIDAPTDVLSFPSFDFSPPAHVDSESADSVLRSAEPVDDCQTAVSANHIESDTGLRLPPELSSEINTYLGDIIIAVPYTERQAYRYHRLLQDELNLLVVHGVLHLLGYDHETEAEEAQMWAIQREILGA